ncbi:MAG: GNAT family N-acetyltransferase [Chloroflexota bacterium]
MTAHVGGYRAERPGGAIIATAYLVREATVADAPVLARQRRLMFDAIDPLPADEGDQLEAAVLRFILKAMPAGTFHAWVVEATSGDGARIIVAGGGLQLRTLMARPGHVHGDPEGLIVSMWTEPAHRRRGLGRLVVEAILAWGQANGVTRFTLHASDEGRPLYELFGFAPTNEMRRTFTRDDPDAVS